MPSCPSVRRAAKNLQTHVMFLRKTVGADRIDRLGGGYQLTVEPGERDADHPEAEKVRAHLTANQEARV